MTIKNRVLVGPDDSEKDELFVEATAKVQEIADRFIKNPEKTEALVLAMASSANEKTEALIAGDCGTLLRLLDMSLLSTVKQLASGGHLTKPVIEDIALRMTYLAKSRYISEEEFTEASDTIMPAVIASLMIMVAAAGEGKEDVRELLQGLIKRRAEEPKAAEPTQAPRFAPKPPKF